MDILSVLFGIFLAIAGSVAVLGWLAWRAPVMEQQDDTLVSH